MAQDRPHSHQYEFFMLGLCVYALGGLAVHSFAHPAPTTVQILDGADVAVCAIFFADFLFTLFRSRHKWRYFLTWGWLDLLSSIPTVSAFRWGRAARAGRILRVLRGVRATRLLVNALMERRAQSVLLAALFSSFLLVVFASIAVLQFETGPDANIKDGGDALWWALTTISTVGYGDRFPTTSEGRIVAVVLMTAGVGLFATVSGFVASWFLAPKNQEHESEIAELRQEIRSLTESLRAHRAASDQ